MLGINGLGRIGRLVLRASFEQNQGHSLIEAINDPGMGPQELKYFLKYDSAHGVFPYDVEAYDQGIIVNKKKIPLYNELDPSKIPWGKHSVQTVLESSGKFLTTESNQAHLNGGAKQVIISAPPKDDTPLFVYGVNHTKFNQSQKIISNASCTTNCLAPVAKIIHDSFGIESGLMTTIHAATASQAVVDQAVKKGQSLRGGRATGSNIVPYSTGAAKALGKVIESLKGKVTGTSFRVPVVNVSVVDFTFRTEKDCTYAQISEAVKKGSKTPELSRVVEWTDDELVSTDFMHNSHSSIFDHKAGISVGSKFFKIVCWYDNEWGYSNRMLDLAAYIQPK